MTSSFDEIAALLPAGRYTLHGFGMETTEDPDGNQGSLTLLFTTSAGLRMQLSASGVRNVEIDTGAWSPIGFAALEITDMTADQWPGVKYRVSTDDDCVAFYCAALEARVAE